MIIILQLSRVLSCSWKLVLHGYRNYDVTPTFSDITANAISSFDYPGNILSLILPINLKTMAV